VSTADIIGMSRDELRKYALSLRSLHDPLQQPDNGYNRCENCHYTRHPCDTYEMASAVLELLDSGRTDDQGERRPVGEYSGFDAEMFLRRGES
jgi:hypothetical protein